MDPLWHIMYFLLLIANIIQLPPKRIARGILRAYLREGYTGAATSEVLDASIYISSIGLALFSVCVGSIEAIYQATRAGHSIVVILIAALPAITTLPALGWLMKRNRCELVRKRWSAISKMTILRSLPPLSIAALWLYSALVE